MLRAEASKTTTQTDPLVVFVFGMVSQMNVPRGNAAEVAAQGSAAQEPAQEKSQFEQAARSLHIVDYGLFVDPS